MIGDGWYVGADRDRMIVAPEDPVGATVHLLDTGYGTDAIPDILGVVLRGPLDTLDARTAAIVHAVHSRVPDAVTIVTATGSQPAEDAQAVAAADVGHAVNRALGARVVEADVAGGFFLDPVVLASTGRSSGSIVQTMSGQADRKGDALFADVYPGFSVAFDRYC